MAFFLGKSLKFIASLQFMNDSLEKLAKNITISDMKYTSQEFQDVELMKRKGVYLYDYMGSFDKFNDENLPLKEKFFLYAKPGWSNFCTLVGHFSKLFEFAGLSRLKIPIFVPKSGCSLKKKKRSSLGSKIPIFVPKSGVL